MRTVLSSRHSSRCSRTIQRCIWGLTPNGPEDQQALQKDLTALEDWANLWQLRFNAQKCKVMHLGTSNGNLSYHNHQDGEEVQLQVTELEKDLGIYIDPGLTFSSHCEQKVNKLLGMIRRSYTYLDNDTVKALYTSLIWPHLEYGGGGGMERYQTSDIRPPKKSNIRYQTPPKYQILRVHKNQISGFEKSDIRPQQKSIIRYHTP